MLIRTALASALAAASLAGCASNKMADDCKMDCCAPSAAAGHDHGAKPATSPATAPAGHDHSGHEGHVAPAPTPATAPAAVAPATKPAEPAVAWTDLFDGKSLTGWHVSDFAGHGEVEAKGGLLTINSGEGLSGVNYTGELPKTNYEIEVIAKRVDGSDFFCGLTFPVADSHASLIVGGWGGAVIGISSIDDADAAHNETTSYDKFEKDRWYKVRLKVTPEKIQAWIDDAPVVDVEIKGKKVSLRVGIEEAKPLGLSTWMTSAAIKSAKLRKL